MIVVWNLVRVFWFQDRHQFVLPLITLAIAPVLVGYMASRLDPLGGWPAAAGTALLTAFTTPMTQVGSAALDDRFEMHNRTLGAQWVSKSGYFSARIGLGVVEIALFSSLALASIWVLGFVQLTIGSFSATLGVFAVAAAGLCALGLIAAESASTRDGGWTLVSLGSIALLFVSPVFYDQNVLPIALGGLVWLSPYTHVSAILVTLSSEPALSPLQLLARLAAASAVSALLLGLAYRRLRW